ncbi:MAG: M28 family peptidase [Aquificaceae bacterium]
MKGERLELFKEFAYRFLAQNRLIGSDGHLYSQRLIEGFLEENLYPYRRESFFLRVAILEKAWVEVEDKRVEGIAYLGSKKVVLEGFVKRNYLEGDIALIPNLTRDKALEAQRRKALAIITYREKDKVDGYIYGPSMGVDIPVLSLRREDIKDVEDFRVRLFISSREKGVRCENITMEVGRGPIIYLVAHRDTVQNTYGAMANGIGTILLLFLFNELKDGYHAPYKLRFLLSDAREWGSKGVRHHLEKGLRHVFYCINLEGIGWHNPCVIYKDMGGYNGERINELFYKHLRDLRVGIDFCKAKERDGDHIPFKEVGVQSLFLSSHPFTIRHTQYDLYDAVNWDVVAMWYEVILSFLRRFHKL